MAKKVHYTKGRQALTNFSSQQTVCEPFADGAAQVCSLVHTYAHLVRKPFANHLVRMCVLGLM